MGGCCGGGHSGGHGNHKGRAQESGTSSWIWLLGLAMVAIGLFSVLR